MDSDCLIKLVRSSLKEIACRSFVVVIPTLVKREVVEDSGGRPDAMVVKDNLEKKMLSVSKGPPSISKGEEAVFTVFQSGRYDAICSDDKKFVRRLRSFQVPYLTPAVLIAVLVKNGKLTVHQGLQKLESLAPMIDPRVARRI